MSDPKMPTGNNNQEKEKIVAQTQERIKKLKQCENDLMSDKTDTQKMFSIINDVFDNKLSNDLSNDIDFLIKEVKTFLLKIHPDVIEFTLGSDQYNQQDATYICKIALKVLQFLRLNKSVLPNKLETDPENNNFESNEIFTINTLLFHCVINELDPFESEVFLQYPHLLTFQSLITTNNTYVRDRNLIEDEILKESIMAKFAMMDMSYQIYIPNVRSKILAAMDQNKTYRANLFTVLRGIVKDSGNKANESIFNRNFKSLSSHDVFFTDLGYGFTETKAYIIKALGQLDKKTKKLPESVVLTKNMPYR
jgi:hypothetical protein